MWSVETRSPDCSFADEISFIGQQPVYGSHLLTADHIQNFGFPFDLLVEAGRTYKVKVSTNFLAWEEITNFTSSSAAFQALDATATNRTRSFHRVILAP